MSNLKGLVFGAVVGAGAVFLASPYGEKYRKVLLEKYGELSEKAIAAAQTAKQRVAPAAVPAEGAAAEEGAEAPKTYIDIDGVKQKVAATAQKVSAATASYTATAKERGAAVAQTAKERGAAVAEAAKGRAQSAAEVAKGFAAGTTGDSAKDDELRAKIDEARERIAAQIAANAAAAQAGIDNVAAVAEEVAENVAAAAEADKPEAPAEA